MSFLPNRTVHRSIIAFACCHFFPFEPNSFGDAVGERFTFNDNTLVKLFKVFGHKQERIDIDSFGDKQSLVLQGYSVSIC